MRYTKYIALLATLFAAVACTNFEYGVEGGLNNNVEGETEITIYGNITRFSDYEVGTRANKTPDESYVSNMALAVFPVVNEETGEVGNCVNYAIRSGDNLLYTLDRSLIPEEYEDKKFVLYIFANHPDLPSTYNGSLDDLLNIVLKYPGITRPDKGFPMIGSLGDKRPGGDGKTFVLMPMDGNRMELPLVNGTPTDYLNIPMNAIFAKISFEITVSADQDVDIHDPARFELARYEVHNLPDSVSFRKAKNMESVQGVSDEPIEIAMTGIAQGGDEGGGSSINFDFYLPERLLTPATSAEEYTYPLGEKGGDVTGYSNIPAENRKYAQRYKPALLGGDQKATFVRIWGKYRDHQEYYHDVSYDIYIGADNYGDFNIERNSQYINKLNIKGITSSADQAVNPDVISIDHRVNVTRSTPLIISIRRETQLDAHYEVRPLRLRMAGESVPAGAKVTVEVLNEDKTTNNLPNWVRLEKSRTTSDHIASGVSAGKRKYFTTDLVTNTLAGNTTLTYEFSELSTTANATAWIYVDENTNASPVHDTRSATIRVTYYEGNEKKDEKDYVISQYNLHQIQGESNPNPYYIECYEEYLYNYDSEEPYGQIKEEGLPWGLDGKQLSNKLLSFNVTENNSEWQDYIAENPALLTYDFYTWAQDSEVLTESGIVETARHDFAGQEFTKKIVSTAGIQYLTMAEQAESAVQYCYNRNKRNTDGSVDVKWYLPSTDEMEDFIVAGYSYYEEFQNKYYWTSQPAYNRNAFYYEYKNYGGGVQDAFVFKVYEDNIKYARATRVGYDLQPIPSGLNDKPKVEGSLPDAEKNSIMLGYFGVWHQWKRSQDWLGRTSYDTTPKYSDQFFDEKRDRSETGKRYYAFVSPNYDMAKEEDEIEDDYDMRQEGYMRRTTPNRVRCAYRND